jgi:hypothetical protein
MQDFPIGAHVRVVALPAYVKTADTVPMLRPPDVIRLGLEGIVRDRQPGGYWAIQFDQGIYLLDSQYLELV